MTFHLTDNSTNIGIDFQIGHGLRQTLDYTPPIITMSRNSMHRAPDKPFALTIIHKIFALTSKHCNSNTQPWHHVVEREILNSKSIIEDSRKISSKLNNANIAEEKEYAEFPTYYNKKYAQYPITINVMLLFTHHGTRHNQRTILSLMHMFL